MSQVEVLNLLSEGIAAVKVGNKDHARTLLLKATELNPNNELGWLWLAGVAESSQDGIAYLQKVLALNPDNQNAIKGIKWFQAQSAQQVLIWQCPLCLSKDSQQLDECPSCSAILTLKNLDALLDNSQVEHKIVRQAVDRLKDQSNDDRDFETNFNLGLAYLNLKHWREGIKYLQAAVRILPDNKNLVEQVNELAKKIALKKAKISGEGSSKGIRPGVILAVDDSPTIRKLVSITLEKQGYQVLLAEDGLEALAIISEKTPDLILLDITMPRMDGYQLCQTIKENQKTEHIPVVMLSGNDGFFDKVRGRVAGSTEYITKPFDSDLLVQTVKKYTLSPGTGEKEVVRQSNAA